MTVRTPARRRGRVKPEALSDEHLVRRYATAPSEALFTELTRRHWESAFGLAYRCLGDAAAAEDVAQEVFLKLARGLGSGFELQGAFRPWLQSRVLNAVRNHVRGTKRRSKRERAVANSEVQTVEQRAERADEARRVRREVANLPEELRLAVVLRYFEGLSHAKVAETLGWKPGTASDRIRRGVAQLRVQLAGVSVGPSLLKEFLRQAPTPPAAPPAAPHALWVQAQAPVRGALIGTKLLAGLATVVAAALVLAVLWPDAAPPAVAPVAQASPAAPGGPADVAPLQTLEPADANANANAPAPASIGDDGHGPVPALGDAPGVVVAEPAEARDALPAPADDALLAGRVVSAVDGAPLAGAQVSATLVAATRSRSAGRVATDALGRFALPADRDRDPYPALHVLIQCEGYALLRRELPLDALPEGPVEFVMQPGGAEVHARLVSLETGEPLAAIKVELEQRFDTFHGGSFAGEVERQLRTGALGGVRQGGLSDGRPVRLTVLAGQGLAAESFTLAATRDGEPTQLEVPAAAKLTLRIVGPNGQRAPDAAVDLERLDQRPGAGYPAWKQPRERLAFDSLPPGRYRVNVAYPWEGDTPQDRRRYAEDRVQDTADVSQEVTLAAGEARELELQVAAAAHGTLVCEVRDGKGRAVSDAFVMLDLHGGDPERSPGTHTDANGKAVFGHLEPGTYTVTLVQQSHQDQEVVVTANKTVNCQFEARSTRRFTGRVVDADGNPLAGVRLDVSPMGGGGVEEGLTDAEGRFAIDDVEEGTVMVSVEADGFTPIHRPVVSADGADVVLTLEAGSSLTVVGRVSPEAYAELLADAEVAKQESRYELADGVQVDTWLELADGSGRGGDGEAAWTADGAFTLTWPSLPRQSGVLYLRLGQRIVSRHAFATGQARLELGLLTVEAGHTLEGRVNDETGLLVPGAYGSVSATPLPDRPGAPSLYRADLRPDGSFVLRGLPGEQVKLHVYVGGPGDTYATAEVLADPRSGQPVAVRLTQRADANQGPQLEGFRFTILDRDGPLAQAGWETGDVWIGYGKNVFADLQGEALLLVFTELEARGQAGDDQSTVKALVRRGDERLTLPLDLGRLPQPGQPAKDFAMEPVQKP